MRTVGSRMVNNCGWEKRKKEEEEESANKKTQTCKCESKCTNTSLMSVKRANFEASSFIFLSTIFHQASSHLKLVVEIH